jgi:protein-tyrosine kinase
MSRVFEALTKATNDKLRRSGGEVDGGTSAAIGTDPELSNEGPSISVNGYSRHNRALVRVQKSSSKSWREHLEELCFGWDLRRYASHPIVALEENSAAAEQYKILRAQLKRLCTGAGIRTIMITSPVKKDGKTIVAVNLAASMALEYDQKVLLVDADLRAPSTHHYFDIDLSSGLTDHLSSTSPGSVKSLIRTTHLSGLRVIPAGRPSRFASELLGSDKMRVILDEIRTTFPEHITIIDSPPVLATSDPLVLSRQVDGVIMVIRADKTPRDYLSKALHSLSSDKVLGVVLNGAELGLSSRYYYYEKKGDG